METNRRNGLYSVVEDKDWVDINDQEANDASIFRVQTNLQALKITNVVREKDRSDILVPINIVYLLETL